jgi:hypothetical protein
MGKPHVTKEQCTPGTAEWFWYKMERDQVNAMLKYVEKGGRVPPGVDPEDVVRAALQKSDGGRPTVTTVNQRNLLRLLKLGNLPAEAIRDVLLFGSAYTVMDLHRIRPDLLPAAEIEQHIKHEATQLIELHFVRGRQNDKRLRAFINKVEKIPGLAEIVAVHAVHAL